LKELRLNLSDKEREKFLWQEIKRALKEHQKRKIPDSCRS
jgi:Fe-S cluster biosynthesis and repair protein YggX